MQYDTINLIVTVNEGFDPLILDEFSRQYPGLTLIKRFSLIPSAVYAAPRPLVEQAFGSLILQPNSYYTFAVGRAALPEGLEGKVEIELDSEVNALEK